MSLDRRALLGGLAVTPFAAPAFAQATPTTPDAALDAAFASPGAPALAGMIVTRQGVEWAGVRGVRREGSSEPATLDDRWHLGSNTKAMTATVFATLVEEGQARWAMPVAEAFPGVAVDPAWGDTTLDDFMHHRAGLLDPSVIGRDWLMTARSDPRSLPEQRAAIVERALGAPPAGPRGTFAYGNANYILVGAAIERITGGSWEAAMRERLFRPLGVTTGGFGPPPSPNAWGHRAVEGSRVPMDPTHPGADNPLALGPAGVAHMALADYARFLGVFLNRGAGLLRPETVAHLITPPAGEGRSYACGWAVQVQPWGGVDGPGPVLGHEGTNTMWHAFATVAPERGLAFVAMANDYATGSRACQQLARGLTALRTGG